MSNKQLESRFEAFKMLVAVLIALGIGAVVVFIVSEDPMKAMGEFVLGPLSSIRRFGAVIEKAIPLTFTGVAICMMFQANMFNLVVEGSFLLSGLLSVAFVVSGVPLPGIVMLIIALVISIVSGIGCAFIPTILKAKWNANEVVASL
ncbi:MAG: ABC transporter permease, partial [Oscillospiraceae bacterium]